MKCLITSFFLVLLAADSASAASGIVVNEYYNGTGAANGATKMVNDEYIEFALTQNMTSAALAALTFGDSNSQTNSLQGVFHFDKTTLDSVLSSANLTSFLAGTIIVVKGTGLGAQNLTYNPLSTNTTNIDLWSLELVAGQGAKDHPETKINGTINIANAGDVVWISSGNPPANNTDTSGFLDAIGHDNSPGLIANQVIAKFGASHILSANVSTNAAVSNIGNGTVVLSQTVAPTMGTFNNATNTTWLSTLRTGNFTVVPEPSRVFLLLIGTTACIFRRQRQKGPRL